VGLPDSESFRFDATVWVWRPGEAAAWIFLTLPRDQSDEIREVQSVLGPQRGFGSVRVEATIGATTWRTSVFPDKGSGCYVLPLKKSVRVAEGVEVDDVVSVKVRLVL
jgi:Domain of unknown function (DUF1905)